MLQYIVQENLVDAFVNRFSHIIDGGTDLIFGDTKLEDLATKSQYEVCLLG